MLLWRLTSIILKIEAPRPAADVRKPDRSEWPAKSFGASPTRRPLALTTLTPGGSASRPLLIRLPLPIGGTSGPGVTLGAPSHARTAFTGQATEPATIAMVSPAPSWSVFDRR